MEECVFIFPFLESFIYSTNSIPKCIAVIVTEITIDVVACRTIGLERHVVQSGQPGTTQQGIVGHLVLISDSLKMISVFHS